MGTGIGTMGDSSDYLNTREWERTTINFITIPPFSIGVSFGLIPRYWPLVHVVSARKHHIDTYDASKFFGELLFARSNPMSDLSDMRAIWRCTVELL